MAIARQVITSILPDGTDMLGTKHIAVKIADESIVSGSLLTVEHINVVREPVKDHLTEFLRS